MAKKKSKSGVTDAIMNVVKSRVLYDMKKQFDDFGDKVHDIIRTTQQKFIRSLISIGLGLLGVIFLIAGIAFLLTDLVGISRTTIFIGAGILLILISVILGQSAKLLKY